MFFFDTAVFPVLPDTFVIEEDMDIRNDTGGWLDPFFAFGGLEGVVRLFIEGVDS